MDFFDKLGKKASEAYKVTADKTGKIAKETKLKFKINELKTQIEDVYEEIGKKVYEKHIREEEISINTDLEEKCTKIDVLSDEIDTLLKECMELKDKKQCPQCYKEIDKEYNYCPNCGEKQNDEPSREVEILEDLEDKKIDEDDDTEKQIIIEDLKEEDFKKIKNEENEEITDLEKTVQIESDIYDNEEDETKK